MTSWYHLKEQSAGATRLHLLWLVYRFLGLKALTVFLYPIVFFIFLFAGPARSASRQYRQVFRHYTDTHHLSVPTFSGYRHLLSYAISLADKFSVLCDPKTPVSFEVDSNSDWPLFRDLLQDHHGAFLLSSHLGNIEVFAGFGQSQPDLPQPQLHALMQVGQNQQFHTFLKHHQRRQSFRLYPAENLSVETVMGLYEALNAGDLLLMAGDRVSAQNPEKTVTTTLLDCTCPLPSGVFRYAKSMKHPTFALCLIRTKPHHHRLFVKKLDTSLPLPELAQQYASFLEALLIRYPDQWYNFYPFFTQP